MKLEAVMALMLTLLLTGMLTLALNIQQAMAEPGTVYIKADGSVVGTGKIQRDGNIYTFTDNISDSIIIERDNIVVDGAGYTLQGTGDGTGIFLSGRSNVTIKNVKIREFDYGIWLNSSSPGCKIFSNYVKNNTVGIILNSSSYNTIYRNTITESFNISVVLLDLSEENRIYENNITNSVIMGIDLYNSTRNVLFHNNFINNTFQASVLPWCENFWNESYPSGGNYWSNYNGTDVNRGSNQDQLGRDGIGDTQYVITDVYNTDHYPLMHPWTPTETIVRVRGVDHPVTITSNTTISEIQATANTLRFTASGPTGERGYILVIFPMINTTPIEIYIDGERLTPPPFPVINSNGTHYFIYFEFTLSTHDITIQFATPVGGIWIPVNKFSLLASYIALVSTIILAISISVAYIKRGKKQ